MAFTSCPQGNLKDVFLTETEIIDRFVGNQLWLWGQGNCGQLGNTSVANRSSPIQTSSSTTNWSQVSLGTAHSAAIKTDGTLWVWGCAANGRLGTNSITNRSEPVQTTSSCNNWRQVSLGNDFSAAVKTDGTLWLWGANGSGNLGNCCTVARSSPVQTFSCGTNWKQVSLGASISGAIKTDGTLWMWGSGVCGTLGNNDTLNQSSPVQTVSATANWKQVSLGACHSAAIKTDGTLWLWGLDTSGQLGDNSTLNSSSPIQTLNSGNNWKQVNLGNIHSSAIKVDGTLWLWGGGSLGRLGNNSTLNQSIPVQTVSTSNNWKQVSLSGEQSAAIKTDGTLWLWGCGVNGILGNNSTLNQSSPVQTICAGINWKQVGLGGTHSSAVVFTES